MKSLWKSFDFSGLLKAFLMGAFCIVAGLSKAEAAPKIDTAALDTLSFI